MRISWKSFAQRRNLNLKMFNNMTYEQYVLWCENRRVTPVDSAVFAEENKIQIKNLDKPVVQVGGMAEQQQIMSAKNLKKLRKSKLIELCKQRNCVLVGNETKNNLIRMLLSMNK